jgi:hypothetical protein
LPAAQPSKEHHHDSGYAANHRGSLRHPRSRHAHGYCAAVAGSAGTPRNTPSCRKPAEEYTPIQVNDKLYLIGGNAAVLTPGARPTHPARVMVYDLANNTWTEKKNTPFFADHMSAATVNGKIYVFGGSGAMTQEAPSATLDTAWEYDPASDSWKALAKLNGKRTAGAATEFGGKIYFIGGSTDTTGPDGRTQNGGLVVGTNEVYDPATNRWETKKADADAS